MKNPLDYFDAIYCINLDKRKDRWEHMSVQFEKLGISDRVERFSAIDCDTKDKRNDIGIEEYGMEFNTGKEWNYQYPLPGATGGTMSHREVVKLAKNRGLKNVLILEDDIEIFDNWGEVLGCALTELDEHDWHLFYLGWNFKGDFDKMTTNLAQCVVHQHHTKKHSGVRWGGAYAVNSTIFDYLIDNINPFDRRKHGRNGFIDFYYPRDSNIKKYLANPHVIFPNQEFIKNGDIDKLWVLNSGHDWRK
jgi:GR25 family glycosyltransferase involved in LPS biosynthesis